MEDFASVAVGQCAVPAAICWFLWWVQIDTVHSLLLDRYASRELKQCQDCMLSVHELIKPQPSSPCRDQSVILLL